MANVAAAVGRKKLIELMLLALAISMSLALRLDDIYGWHQAGENNFYRGEPLLTEMDGYYYLTLGRDLLEGRYHPVDEKRAVPDNPARPWPPPLLSVLTALAAKVVPLSLDWIATLMPPILGVLVVIPLYGLGRHLGGPVMALVAVAVGMASNAYIARSCLGRYDTDFGVLFFALTIPYLFLRFGIETGLGRYRHFLAATVLSLLFGWWWDQAPEVVAALCLYPLLLALGLYYRPKNTRERLIFLLLLATVATGLLCWREGALLTGMAERLHGKFLYLTKVAANIFPPMGVIISEQNPMSFEEMAKAAAGSYLVFFLALAGLALMAVKRPRESLFLAPTFVLAGLSGLAARRFMIFLSPLTGLGLGFLLFLCREHWRHVPAAPGVALATAGLVVVHMAVQGTYYNPIYPPPIIAGMEKLAIVTPPEAVIWNWGDTGYPIIYWGRRATVNDGAAHSGERSVYNAIPFATGDFRLAANFICFFVAHGAAGIHEVYAALPGGAAEGLPLLRRILAAGPAAARELIATNFHATDRMEEVSGPLGKVQERPADSAAIERWLAFFFPANARPIYLFIDWPLMLINQTLHWLATWDVTTGRGELLLPKNVLFDATLTNDRLEAQKGGITGDMASGELQWLGTTIPVAAVTITDGNKTRTNSFSAGPIVVADNVSPFLREETRNADGMVNRTGRYCVEIHLPSGYLALEDCRTNETIVNQLFWRQGTEVAPFFREVLRQPPHYGIWQVEGERFQRGNYSGSRFKEQLPGP